MNEGFHSERMGRQRAPGVIVHLDFLGPAHRASGDRDHARVFRGGMFNRGRLWRVRYLSFDRQSREWSSCGGIFSFGRFGRVSPPRSLMCVRAHAYSPVPQSSVRTVRKRPFFGYQAHRNGIYTPSDRLCGLPVGIAKQMPAGLGMRLRCRLLDLVAQFARATTAGSMWSCRWSGIPGRPPHPGRTRSPVRRLPCRWSRARRCCSPPARTFRGSGGFVRPASYLRHLRCWQKPDAGKTLPPLHVLSGPSVAQYIVAPGRTPKFLHRIPGRAISTFRVGICSQPIASQYAA